MKPLDTLSTFMKKILLLGCFSGFVAAAMAADFQIKNEEEFRKIVSPHAKVEKLAGGMRFVEGPVWIPEGDGYLIFSDIPANELKKWSAADGLTTFRSPSNNANGNILDTEGRLITCEHGARRVSRTEMDGTVKTLVAEFEGKKFNSPNDAAVKSDGSIWFTDPDYGLAQRPKELEGNFVFRFAPNSGEITIVARDFDKPNGLCFSPDESLLYIADSGSPRHIRVFEVRQNGSLSEGKLFCKIDAGVPDGIRVDKEGRLYSSAGDGVQIFSPDGELIGKILVPESVANLCFGGENNQTLFMTARSSLYSIPLQIAGAVIP
jgi:gluconolactonase